MDDFEYNIVIKRSLKNLEAVDFQYNGTDPTDLPEWSQNKKNHFERKKVIKLQKFFNDQVAYQNKWPKKKTWIKDYTPGEIKMFEEMLERLVSSKNAEILQKLKEDKYIESKSTVIEGTFEEDPTEDHNADGPDGQPGSALQKSPTSPKAKGGKKKWKPGMPYKELSRDEVADMSP